MFVIRSWTPPHARYTEERYKNQPKSISDYEPGRSSIAMKQPATKAVSTTFVTCRPECGGGGGGWLYEYYYFPLV